MQFLGTFALGAVLAVSLGGSNTPSSDNVNFWLNQAKAQYNWNMTSTLNWNAVNRFVGVAVSPLGDLYGIQSYTDGRTDVRFAYKFNFQNGQWSQFDPNLQIQNMRFDKMGNMFILDRQGNVFSNTNRTTNLLTNVQDFEVTTANRMYAISNGLSQSSNAFSNGWDGTANGFTYKQFSGATYKGVGLINEVPVYQLANGSLVGYGSQCVQDFSIGVDGAVWAISCTVDQNTSNSTFTNYQILKWDPFLAQWYQVKDQAGIRIAAYNEESAAVLRAEGVIYVSSHKGDKNLPQYLNRTFSGVQMFSDSKLLSFDQLQWIKDQVDINYGAATLVWRASQQGWSSTAYHGAVDGKGASITFIKSSTGQIFGGFLAINQTTNAGWMTDYNSFLFSATNKIRLGVTNPGYAYYSATDRIAYFGSNDLYVVNAANTSTGSSTTPGNQYAAIPGMSAGSTAANTYFHQSSPN